MAILRDVMKGPNEIVPFNHPHIEYPQYYSRKFDGYRMLNLCGERLLSPALKDFPNRLLAEQFRGLLDYCRANRIVTDGEVFSEAMTFDELKSVVRSYSKPIPPSVKYYIFDMMTEDEWNNGNEQPFIKRWIEYTQTLNGFSNIVLVPQNRVDDAAQAQHAFEQAIALGHEGIILRQPAAYYKHGRCTTKQDGMWKFKEFQTLDGIIVGVEEQMKLKEGVARTTNEVGKLERRYEQELYEPAGMVGAFEVAYLQPNAFGNGMKFKVKMGKGFTNEDKRKLWDQYVVAPNLTLGHHIEFKFMPHGAKDKPRIGSLVRFRPDLD